MVSRRRRVPAAGIKTTSDMISDGKLPRSAITDIEEPAVQRKLPHFDGRLSG